MAVHLRRYAPHPGQGTPHQPAITELADQGLTAFARIDACFGPSSMTAQGVVGTPEGAPLVGAPMAVPPVGDDRIGEFDTYPQGFPGSTNPGSPAYLHTAIIRDGPVLMAINIAEENASPTEQQLTQDDIDAIITTAAAKLPKPVTRSTPEP